MIARGASYPVDPMASLPVSTMGCMTLSTSSEEYPNSASLTCMSSTERPTCLPEDSLSRSRRFFSSQSR